MTSDVPEACRKPGRPRDAHADVAILQAVLDLVAETGLTHLSMDAVATKAGVGKATIYRRWPSKEALVVDAWRTLIGPVETPDTGTLRGDVEVLLGRVVEKVGSGDFEVLSQIAAAARTDPGLADSLREYVATRRQPMRTVLERAVERGELRADVDLDLLHDALVGPVFYRLLLSRGTIDHAMVRGAIDIVLAGNAADVATQPR